MPAREKPQGWLSRITKRGKGVYSSHYYGIKIQRLDTYPEIVSYGAADLGFPSPLPTPRLYLRESRLNPSVARGASPSFIARFDYNG